MLNSANTLISMQEDVSEEGMAQEGHELVASFPSGSTIPDFQVQSLDMWGNPTSTPCPDMPFHLIIRSTALEPAESDHQFAPFATVKGLTALHIQVLRVCKLCLLVLDFILRPCFM